MTIITPAFLLPAQIITSGAVPVLPELLNRSCLHLAP